MDTKFLKEELLQLEGYIPLMDKLSLVVSQVPIAWHIDHMLKPILHICKGLKESDPITYKKNFSALRTFCRTLNFIPRGKVQSPKYVLPPEVIMAEDILTQLEEVKTKLQGLEGLDQNANINHPFFKQLNLEQAKNLYNFIHNII